MFISKQYCHSAIEIGNVFDTLQKVKQRAFLGLSNGNHEERTPFVIFHSNCIEMPDQKGYGIFPTISRCVCVLCLVSLWAEKISEKSMQLWKFVQLDQLTENSRRCRVNRICVCVCVCVCMCVCVRMYVCVCMYVCVGNMVQYGSE